MNYIDEVREELSKHTTVGRGLMRVYTLLVLVKGEDTTLRDVHDAWSVNINDTWNKEKHGEHRSLLPFEDLIVEIQEKDQQYVDAIRLTARILKERADE